jgi:hypothetical protein
MCSGSPVGIDGFRPRLYPPSLPDGTLFAPSTRAAENSTEPTAVSGSCAGRSTFFSGWIGEISSLPLQAGSGTTSAPAKLFEHGRPVDLPDNLGVKLKRGKQLSLAPLGDGCPTRVAMGPNELGATARIN